MKLKRFFAGLAVTAMVCAAAMTSAGAYYTAHDPAAGDIPFAKNQSTFFHEDVDVNDGKYLTVSNTGDLSENVRARLYYPAELEGKITADASENWKLGDDGWYYYQPELEPGTETEALHFSITLPEETARNSSELNIVAVYEAKLPGEVWG